MVYLDLGDNLITNIGLVTGFRHLGSLDLDGTGLYDISFLANLTYLPAIIISHNEIGDLRPLRSLNSLLYADFSDNGLNLSPGTITGSNNAAVVAKLQSRGVTIPTLDQSSHTSILPGSPYRAFGGNLALDFSTVPGRTYTVQSSTNLTNWTDLAILSSTSPILTYDTSDRGVLKQRFFRINASALPPRMVLGTPLMASNGAVILPVFGVGNQPFVLQTSTNLVQWTSLFTNRALNGSFCINATATNAPRRYYRLKFP
jgi:hypothetical protein